MTDYNKMRINPPNQDVECPKCGSPEWFPGAACWNCGWEGSAAEAYRLRGEKIDALQSEVADLRKALWDLHDSVARLDAHPPVDVDGFTSQQARIIEGLWADIRIELRRAQSILERGGESDA